MRKLKDLFLISVVLLLVSCSMSAKSDKNETGVTDRKNQGSNENGRKDLRKPVKIIVKSVYSGKQDMAEVFGSVALDNIRRKMQEG